MYSEDAFLGFPINFQDICLIYPPSVENIIKVGFNNFLICAGLLTKSQEDLEDELKDIKEFEGIDPFTYLLVMSSFSKETDKFMKQSFQLFTHENITILPELQIIVIGKLEEKRIINKDNFFDFQNTIRAAIGEPLIDKPDPNEDPRIKRFKALARKRDRVKAKQNKNASKEFITLLTSVCCMNMGLNPLNIGKISYASIKQLMARYTEKDSYETRIAANLAGAENKDDSYWIKDIKN